MFHVPNLPTQDLLQRCTIKPNLFRRYVVDSLNQGMSRVRTPQKGVCLGGDLLDQHPRDELATVIEGTWYVGEGTKFDAGKLKSYPAGSFVFIPAGVPHFVAAKEGTVVVQLTGVGKWQTDYLEK